MTTMQKFKAYFGMVPPSDYEDDYLEEPGAPVRSVSRERAYRDDYYGESSFRDNSLRESRYAEPGYADGGYRDAEYAYEEAAYEAVPEYAYAGGGRHVAESVDRMRPAGGARLEPLRPSGIRASGSVRQGGHTEQRAELERVFADGPLHKITTLRPSDYGEARTIGERFRDGSPVIMDLVDMSNDDAKRLVDFAAGLAFALRGSFDKVATKVFLLSPADIDVSPEDRRKIAETGFYNHS